MASGSFCPGREQLQRYATGRLDAQTLTKLREHLSTCSACAETVRLLARDDVPANSLVDDALPNHERAVMLDFSSDSVLGNEVLGDRIPPVIKAVAIPTVSNLADESIRDSTPNSSTSIPKQIGQYRILAQIGEGGMGAVYKAVHTKLDKLLALKLLPTRRLLESNAALRFEREMKAIGRLEHPNIVRATDAGHCDGLDYPQRCKKIMPQGSRDGRVFATAVP